MIFRRGKRPRNPGLIDRRTFLRTTTASGLVVLGSRCSGEYGTTADEFGTITVTITGGAGGEVLVTAEAGSLVGQAPQTFQITGTSRSEMLPVGRYAIAYTADAGAGLQIVPGTATSYTVTLVKDAEETITFEVEAITSPTGDLVVQVSGLNPSAQTSGSIDVVGSGFPTTNYSIPAPNASGVGTLTQTLPIGTYTVTYNAPPQHQDNSPNNPVQATITDGGTSNISFAVSQSQTGFATPDILNNASFETGYDGFDNGSTGNADAPRVTTQAYDGQYSLEFDFPPSGSELHYNARYGFSERSVAIFARTFFRLQGAMPTKSMKFFRVADAFYDGPHFGVYAHANGSGNLIAAFQSTGNDNVDLTIGNPTADTWHSLEFEYAYNGGQNGGDAARFWYDNNPVFGSGGGGGAPVWRDLSNDGHLWLDSDASSPGGKPGAIWLPDTVNSGNSNHATFWFDRVAVSTQRIGP